MKIGQRLLWESDKMTLHKRHSAKPALDLARKIRDAENHVQGENEVIGVIPNALLVNWARKHGVSLTDADAMSTVIDKEINDPANKMFKIVDGRKV